MTDSLAAPIFGLVGVLVGSAISTGANFILAIRKEKADAKLKQRERVVLFRTTLRILEADLLQAASVINIIVQNNMRPQSTVFSTKLPSWDSYKEIFAEALPISTWEKVVIAASAASHFNAFMSAITSKSNSPIGPQEHEVATNLHSLIVAARKEITELRMTHDA